MNEETVMETSESRISGLMRQEILYYNNRTIMGEVVSVTVRKTLRKLYKDGGYYINDFANVLYSLSVVNWGDYFRSHLTTQTAAGLTKTITNISENSDSLTFKEYVTFIKISKGNIRWISPDLDLNSFVTLIEDNFKDTKSLIEFVRFVADVALEYDGALPSKEEWIAEISRGDCFGPPAAIVVPMMVNECDNTIPREMTVKNSVLLSDYRRNMSQL